jgi:hypothetical protein
MTFSRFNVIGLIRTRSKSYGIQRKRNRDMNGRGMLETFHAHGMETMKVENKFFTFTADSSNDPRSNEPETLYRCLSCGGLHFVHWNGVSWVDDSGAFHTQHLIQSGKILSDRMREGFLLREFAKSCREAYIPKTDNMMVCSRCGVHIKLGDPATPCAYEHHLEKCK